MIGRAIAGIDETDVYLFDRFLDDADFANIWTHFTQADFVKVHADRFEKVFRLYDGEPLMGEFFRLVRSDRSQRDAGSGEGQPTGIEFPSDDPLSPLARKLVTDSRVRAFVDRLGDWKRLSLQLYIYPPGTGLSWHRDASTVAAFIYYAHQEWNPIWGGELLVMPGTGDLDEATKSPKEETRVRSSPCRTFYPPFNEGTLLKGGVGSFLLPLPNRLVLIRGGVAHTIKKVEAAAGEAFRASVSGFFKLDDS